MQLRASQVRKAPYAARAACAWDSLVDRIGHYQEGACCSTGCVGLFAAWLAEHWKWSWKQQQGLPGLETRFSGE